MGKRIYISLFIILLCTALCGCSNKKEISGTQTSEKPYTDMSAYKGDGGYVTWNNVYDYSGAVDKTYDWGEGIKMPFPKPEGSSGGLEHGTYVFHDISSQKLQEYMNTLKSRGYTTLYMIDGNGQSCGLIYNDEFVATLSTAEVLGEDSVSVLVYSGFVKTPVMENKDVKKLISDNGLLQDNLRFKEYYVVPIENETVRKAGYYECLVFAETYHAQGYYDVKEYLPYYMIIRDGKVCLFEQAVYLTYLSSAVLTENDGEEELVLTSVYFPTEIGVSSENLTTTGVYTYRLENEKFVRTEEHYKFGEYIAYSADGKLKIYGMSDTMITDEKGSIVSYDGHKENEGRRYAYKMNVEKEYSLDEFMTYEVFKEYLR